ncbi:hypothetical protein K450DRAFT_247600 [Umbelopsis ramanniana AG]|uniref:O-fucosyltransferase family protein n=1 Tax=Umbelopsis ramanniana AG TaxID=1314678 RepID=A0AAD5E7K0_UMBRA|nr:uncharacterized protein K450DRAFT_247600 [Umbelopsis ramanniana AG]KAI8578377.1 hypothetical protein K450DRAFT_247600 [Umbelopsis ramanniana AG]
MSYSSNTVYYAMMVAIATIVLCTIAAFQWEFGESAYVYKHTQAKKIDLQGEKFIAYLPHSGLSNQRNELENALLLAGYLNRTLILPPAFLGHIGGWQSNDHLFEYMDTMTKPQPWWNRCKDKLGLADGPCHAKSGYASVPWEYLHSSIFELDIPMRSIRHISLDKIKAMLTLSDDEVHIQHDTSLYTWFLCDIPNEQCPTLDPTIFETGGRRSYDEQWNIEDLRRIEKPLIQLQGIFGTDRVGVSQKQHLELRNKIREALVYRNPTLEKVTDTITERLGGKQQFLSIHVRMGNRQFLGPLHKHIEEQIAFLETAQQRGPGNSTFCEPDDFQIYVATDAKDPRKSPELVPVFERFPCAKVLGDYKDLLPSLESDDAGVTLFQPPQQSIVNFLIPVIDAMVAGHAKDFMGNPSSTYSTYIEQLQLAYSQTNSIA